MSSTGKTIGQRVRELNHEDMKARMEWSKKYSASPEAQDLLAQLRLLQKECEANGHSQGTFHDNGLGWHWWYCGVCGASFGKEYHGPSQNDDEGVK